MANNSQYYLNAGITPPKGPQMTPAQPMGPADYAISFGKNVLNKTIGAASSAIAAPVTIPQKVRGMIADNQRGNILYDKGFGHTYDSAIRVAAGGRSAGQKRASR